MVDYQTFCKRYKLDADSIDARKQYREYQYQLKRLEDATTTGIFTRENIEK